MSYKKSISLLKVSLAIVMLLMVMAYMAGIFEEVVYIMPLIISINGVLSIISGVEYLMADRKKEGIILSILGVLMVGFTLTGLV